MTPDLWLLLLCGFGLLVALGATSGVVNELLWVSEPLVCAAAGVALWVRSAPGCCTWTHP